jgi:hypothetical protein
MRTIRVTRARMAAAVAACGAAALALAGGLSVGAGPGQAAQSTPMLTREGFARLLLHTKQIHGTPALQLHLRQQAGEAPGGPLPSEGNQPGATGARQSGAPAVLAPSARLANVRVNNPAEDKFVDQTTQSETTIAVSGRRVAVGFNDSQRALVRYTAGLNLSGYAYSTDGGRSFTDGGGVPNRPGGQNIGDPWLAADRTGGMSFGQLVIDGETGNLEVGVSASADGGRSWTQPTFASQHPANAFYSGDKDAITIGRSPTSAAADVRYAAWDDFVFLPGPDPNTPGTFFTGLPVSHSTDGGTTWAQTYADKIVSDPASCSFGQFLGAQPYVDPANGTLYVFAERIEVLDPNCTGGTLAISMVEYVSTDGGASFGPAVKVGDIGPSLALRLGPAQIVRTAEFPTVAQSGNTFFVAWNDGAGGHDHLVLATSTGGSGPWTVAPVTSGSGDEIQPALSSDAKGLHLAYYQRNADDTLDVVLSDSRDGGTWTPRRVTSRSFPGVFTAPQFDPIIAFGYMGDYIANVSDGHSLYLAWGDNRDRVVGPLYPQGRNDPDVFFARR